MSAQNGFREDELVYRRVKVGQEWQTKIFPIVGGRLRIAHEQNSALNIETEIVRLEPDFVVVKATVKTEKGIFNGTGNASAQRDARLADALAELAETRAIARSLRFGGIGVEYTGAEEFSHVVQPEPELVQTAGKDAATNPESGNGNGKPEAKPQPKRNGGKATQAQVRALYALARKIALQEEDRQNLLAPLNAHEFEDLTVADASHLIQYFQTQVPAA